MVRLLLVLLVSGCDDGTVMQPDLAPAPDLLPLHLSAGPTDGTVSLRNADFSIDGSAAGVIGSFSIVHGSGTIELSGKSVQAAVYQRQAFPTENLRLYQTLAVETDRLWVLWFYCSTTDNSLVGVYYEATDGTPVTFETGVGTCQDGDMTSTVAVQFPAIDLPPPPLLPGFTMEGPAVHLDGAQPGSVQLGGALLTVLVFNTVDCTTTCGTPGWTELHALLWDRQGARVCFGIFYLKADDPTHVQLAWSLTLPSLIDPAGGVTLPAAWTIP